MGGGSRGWGSSRFWTCGCALARRPAVCWRWLSSRSPASCTAEWPHSRKPTLRGAVDAPRPLRHAIAGAGQAIAFLTVVPVRGAGRASPLEKGVDAAWFRVVGALVGALAGGVRVGAEQLVGVLPATVLAVASLIAVTGALHQDGLGDVADAAGARGGRERRLAVMRDPVNGTFGTLALVCWTLVIVTAIASLPASRALRTFVVACALGRAAALAHASLLPPARPDGLG